MSVLAGQRILCADEFLAEVEGRRNRRIGDHVIMTGMGLSAYAQNRYR
jgi:hypothetical protein